MSRPFGKRRVRGTVDEFFRSPTWGEIEKKMEGKNPIIFIIVKKAGKGVQNVYIKSGDHIAGLESEQIDELRAQEIDPRLKKTLDQVIDEDAVVQRDIVAKYPEPKIVGIEEHVQPVAPAPIEPETDKEVVEVDAAGEPILTEEDETMKPILPEPAKETNGHAELTGDVDLQPGMRIIFRSVEDDEAEGEIVDLFEEEQQILVSQPGTRKKTIIDVAQIRRLA